MGKYKNIKREKNLHYVKLTSQLTLKSIFTESGLTYRRPVVNTLRPRQNGRRFADDTFKRIFENENVRLSIKISLKFVPKGPINNNPALIRIMAWRRPGDKPLSEPMMVILPMHICVTRPQWVKPWHETLQGQSVAEPGTPIVEDPSCEYKFDAKEFHKKE